MTDLQKIKDYFKHRIEVIAVYLFGSYAVGRDLPFSDIDLGIIVNESDKENLLEKRNQYIVELGRLLRKDIHPVILNNAGEELLKQVFSKGRCLLIRDVRKHDHIKMAMFVKMVEFDYYRKLFHSSLIKNIMEGRR
jgi:predicted nucleotidyltransferase